MTNHLSDGDLIRRPGQQVAPVCPAPGFYKPPLLQPRQGRPCQEGDAALGDQVAEGAELLRLAVAVVA